MDEDLDIFNSYELYYLDELPSKEEMQEIATSLQAVRMGEKPAIQALEDISKAFQIIEILISDGIHS